MAIKGKIIGQFLSVMNRYTERKIALKEAAHHQKAVLEYLLQRAEFTKFGKKYDFSEILESNDIVEAFQKHVPLYTYEDYFDEWMEAILNEEANVCWPDKIKYMALTSGTSGAASKRIPISNEMKKGMLNISLKHFYTLKRYDFPANFFEKELLLLGGSTHLTKVGEIQEGDLSGIMQGNVPYFINRSTRPGKDIAREKSWPMKIERIVEEAPNWDVGLIAGVPSWLLMLMDKIIARHKLNNIHEIWPNFRIFAHGGTSISPYLEVLSKKFGKEVKFSETYLASEGFFAYQKGPGKGMSLCINDNVFFEFVPFNEENFTDGNLNANPEVYDISGIEEHVPYAIIISNASGLWRYMIGDIIEFTNANELEMKITGRIKHFVNLCGEHLSIDNMDDAVKFASENTNISVREYTFFPRLENGEHVHYWFIGTENEFNSKAANEFLENIDTCLKENNDDYNSLRPIKINKLKINMIPVQLFYDWLAYKGMIGAQRKFPRVLSDEQFEDWNEFLTQHKLEFSRTAGL